MVFCFRCFFQANAVFKQLAFLPLTVFLISGVLALTACHSKENDTMSNGEKTTISKAYAKDIQPTSQNLTNDGILSASVSVSQPIPSKVMTDTDEVGIDRSHIVHNPDVKSRFKHDAQTLSLPSGDKRLDFQQAYLANIYTLRHNSPDIQADDTADVAFIKSMIKHRQALVLLAKLQLDYGKNEYLKSFAKDMIISQENEIWLMEHWLKEVYPSMPKPKKTSTPIYEIMENEYQNSINQMHEQMLAGALQQDADMAFAQIILPLLKGGLVLAQTALKYGNDQKIKTIANNIIMNQIPEIQALEKWRKEHF